MIKKISKAEYPYEAEIHKFLSTEPLASHPRNHCGRLIDVLHPPDDPDVTLLVMPLYRSFNNPPFHTVGEIIECLKQYFEVTFKIFCTPDAQAHLERRVFSSCTNVTLLIGMVLPRSFRTWKFMGILSAAIAMQ